MERQRIQEKATLWRDPDLDAYLNQIRLEHAKQLLLSGHPIATVAYETGFAHQSHLTKRFKQIYGVTPGHVFPNRKNIQD